MIFEAADRGRREKETGESRFFLFYASPCDRSGGKFHTIQALSDSGVQAANRL